MSRGDAIDVAIKAAIDLAAFVRSRSLARGPGELYPGQRMSRRVVESVEKVMAEDPLRAQCQSGRDGDCNWDACPQLVNYDHMGCPLFDWTHSGEEA